MLSEIESPRDRDRQKRYLKFLNEESAIIWEKAEKEGIKFTSSAWNDNSNHTIIWVEFETVEDFAKLWGDHEFQSMMSSRAMLVDNCNVRILRPGIRKIPK